MDTKDDTTETKKIISLYCFRKVIPDNLQGVTKLHICFLLRDNISDKIIPDIDVASSLATWLSTIFLQFYDTLIIFINDFFKDLVPLLFQKLLGPYHLCQDIVETKKLGLDWTLIVKIFLLGQT